jgi:hypothetical protein
MNKQKKLYFYVLKENVTHRALLKSSIGNHLVGEPVSFKTSYAPWHDKNLEIKVLHKLHLL